MKLFSAPIFWKEWRRRLTAPSLQMVSATPPPMPVLVHCSSRLPLSPLMTHTITHSMLTLGLSDNQPCSQGHLFQQDRQSQALPWPQNPHRCHNLEHRWQNEHESRVRAASWGCPSAKPPAPKLPTWEKLQCYLWVREWAKQFLHLLHTQNVCWHHAVLTEMG